MGSLRVIATPGHTPGHVSLLDARSNTLLCGDAFATLGGVATTAKSNWKFPLPAIATWHKPTELESAKKLLALKPAHLAPGHGEIVDSPLAAMRGGDRARHLRCRAQGSTRDGWSRRRRGSPTPMASSEATLARVAESLGVRAPSLYNHVEGLPGCCGCSPS